MEIELGKESMIGEERRLGNTWRKKYERGVMRRGKRTEKRTRKRGRGGGK